MAGPLDSLMSQFVGDSPQQAANPINLGYTADGPAAAPLVNQLLLNMQGVQDRQNRASDTANEMNQNVLQQTLLNNPNIAAQRALDMAQKKTMQETFDSGLQKKVITSGLESEFGKNLANMSMSQLQDMQTKAQHFLGMKAMLDNDPSPVKKEQWDYMKKAGKSIGMKNMPDDLTPDAEAMIRAGAAFAEQNLSTINKIMEIRATGQEAQKTAKINIQPGMAGAGVEAMKVENSNEFLSNIAYKKMDAGMPVGAGELQRIHNELQKYIGPYLMQDRGFQMLSANAAATQNDYMQETNPKKKEEKRKVWQEAEKALANRVQQAPIGVPAAPTSSPSKVPPPGKYTYKGVPGTWDGKNFTPDTTQ